MTETAANLIVAPIELFEDFLAQLHDPALPGAVLSPVRYAELVNIDVQTLADQAHVHRNTISCAPGSRGIQQYLRQMLRVIKAATDLGSSPTKALFWYRNEPLRTFGYKTAEQLVVEGRTEDLLHFVTSLEAGSSG